MYRLSRLKYVFPLGLFVCLFLDGSLSHVWAPLFFRYPYSMASELVILWLVLSMVLFPCIVALTRMLAHYFTPSFLTNIMIFFVDLVVFATVNYWAYSLIGVTSVGFGDYLAFSLAPTLALNLVYFVVLYWPIRSLYSWATTEKTM